MDISIFGLGYVGAVSAACLASRGHNVIGVETNAVKVEMINGSQSPVIEKDLQAMIQDVVRAGKLTAVTDAREGVLQSDVSFVCVGTPSNANGSLDLRYVKRVSREIATALKDKNSYHLVVFRSTMLPGTVEETLIPILEETSGKQVGVGFGTAANPEFLRESTAVYDYFHPPKTVIGALKVDDSIIVSQLYEGIDAPLIRTSIKAAEMVKYADNVFHSLKITFGNEIGNICKALGVDSHEIMEIFCQDTKLNLSPYYLKPGFAFGGSCLPKDLRALTYVAKTLDVEVPLLNAIAPSNAGQIRIALNRLLSMGKRKVGVLGFAFKAGTDDLRESPVVELIEQLIGKGYDLRIYDENVSLARLHGANREFIEKRVPHIAGLMVDNPDAIIKHSDVIVIGNKRDEFKKILKALSPDQVVLDLVRLDKKVETEAQYQGICW